MKLMIHPALQHHFKVARLATALGVRKQEALGYLVSFWGWAMTLRENGSLRGIKPPEIAHGSGWEGDDQIFLAGLIKSSLVDQRPLRIHDWMEHQGPLIRKREAARIRQQRRRDKLTKSRSRCRNHHTSVTRDRCDSPGQGEDMNGKGNSKKLERKGSGHEAPPELQDLPLYREDAILCRSLPGLLPTWCKAFPGVDVVAEIQKAHAWEQSNPNRRKKDRVRFLNGWMNRAQDSPRKPDRRLPHGKATIGRFALPPGALDARIRKEQDGVLPRTDTPPAP